APRDKAPRPHGAARARADLGIRSRICSALSHRTWQTLPQSSRLCDNTSPTAPSPPTHQTNPPPVGLPPLLRRPTQSSLPPRFPHAGRSPSASPDDPLWETEPNLLPRSHGPRSPARTLGPRQLSPPAPLLLTLSATQTVDRQIIPPAGQLLQPLRPDAAC